MIKYFDIFAGIGDSAQDLKKQADSSASVTAR